MDDIMTIWAGPGDKVRLRQGTAPWQDWEEAFKLLGEGEHRVARVEVDLNYTSVWLEGFDRPFNSCLLADVQVDQEAAKQREKDWDLEFDGS
jgi:hypothetical protein